MVTTMSLWWGPVSVCPGEVELCHLTALTSSFEIDYTSSHSYQVLHQFTLLPRAIKVFLHVLSQHFLSRAFLITTLAQVRWNVKEVLLAFLYLESQICAAHRETILLISFIFFFPFIFWDRVYVASTFLKLSTETRLASNSKCSSCPTSECQN